MCSTRAACSRSYQRLTLVADNAEGVSAGMDLTFSGFPIGRVRRLSLSDDGKARIHIRVPVSDARWLRTTTIFTLEIPLVGGARIRAFTADLKDPPLPDRAVRPVLRGDANAEIPLMVATLRTVLENVDGMTDTGSSLQDSLKNVRTVTERMAGKQGVLGAALGSEDNAKKLLLTMDRANALLASLNGVSLRLDGVLSKTDQRLLRRGRHRRRDAEGGRAGQRDPRGSEREPEEGGRHPRRRAGGGGQREGGDAPTSRRCAPRSRRACARSAR